MSAPHSPSRLRTGQPAPLPLELVIACPTTSAVLAEAERLREVFATDGRADVRIIGPWDSASAGTKSKSSPDLVVVLGGDGSILRTARWMAYAQAPVLGINLGTLGFLADVAGEEAATAFDDILAGRFRLVDHLMFECDVVRDATVLHRELGLNELVIVAGPPFSMIEITLAVEGEAATTYRADGLIVSTPVGSTAYNLSAGGPIVRKDLDAFVFTPLQPHTLTNRTVVDSAARQYELTVPRPNPGSACVVDGRVVADLAAGDRIVVRRAEPRFTLVETSRHGYYRTLRDKLGWGGGLRSAGPSVTRRTP